MRTRKQLQRAWLPLLTMVVVAACQGADDNSSDAERASIQILINDSPWFSGFEEITKQYERETGNQVSLDVTPFGGMLQKIRTAIQVPESSYDIVAAATPWTVELYESDALTPLAEIEADFALPDEILTYGESYFWNAEKGWRTSDGGELMMVPANLNLHLTYYRADLYEEAGLAPPETWDDALAACRAIQAPPDVFGYAFRGERGGSIQFDWSPIMTSFGARIVADPENGDFTVVVNSPDAKEALDILLTLARECAPENIAAMGQSEVIELLTTGKVLQAHVVAAAWAQMDNPDASAVVGKIDTVPVLRPVDGEHVPVLGNFHLGIPRNLPDDQKQAALEFLKWFLTFDAQMAYAEAGSLPVRADVFASELAERDEFRYFAAYLESIPNAVQVLGYREAPEVREVLGLRLNQALIGELSSAEALNAVAQEIYEIFEASGRDTGMLDPLSEG